MCRQRSFGFIPSALEVRRVPLCDAECRLGCYIGPDPFARNVCLLKVLGGQKGRNAALWTIFNTSLDQTD